MKIVFKHKFNIHIRCSVQDTLGSCSLCIEGQSLYCGKEKTYPLYGHIACVNWRPIYELVY